MSLILIGSRALALRQSQALNRAPLDFDYICTQQNYENWLATNLDKVQSPDKQAKVYEVSPGHQVCEGTSIVEFEIIKPGHSSELFVEAVKDDPDTIETPFGLVPSLNALFSVKSAHKYKKFKDDARVFWKTAIDFHSMKAFGAEVSPRYEAFHKLRSKETYNYNHPSLTGQTKESFFKDDFYKWDHDDIHKSVKSFNIPAYEMYMVDGDPIKCDKEKFFNLSQEVRIAGIREEANVLSIERRLVNMKEPSAQDIKNTWLFALAKVCSSITSGWFRQFGYDNIFEVVKSYQPDYYNRFKIALSNGEIRPFTGSKY